MPEGRWVLGVGHGEVSRGGAALLKDTRGLLLGSASCPKVLCQLLVWESQLPRTTGVAGGDNVPGELPRNNGSRAAAAFADARPLWQYRPGAAPTTSALARAASSRYPHLAGRTRSASAHAARSATSTSLKLKSAGSQRRSRAMSATITSPWPMCLFV